MPRQRSNYSRAPGRKIVNRSWSSVQDAAFSAVPAASKILVGTFSVANPGIDFTTLCVVGSISIASDQSAGIETQCGSFGLILVTDAAVAIGVTVMPSPHLDSSDDGWFVYKSFAQQSSLAENFGPFSYTYDFDSKAKRIHRGVGMQCAVMVSNSHATHGLEFLLQLRTLSMVRS